MFISARKLLYRELMITNNLRHIHTACKNEKDRSSIQDIIFKGYDYLVLADNATDSEAEEANEVFLEVMREIYRFGIELEKTSFVFAQQFKRNCQMIAESMPETKEDQKIEVKEPPKEPSTEETEQETPTSES